MDEQLSRLVTAIVLAPEAAASAVALAKQRSEHQPGQGLAIALEESWWAMREAGRAPRELQPFLADGDPVMSLTVRERSLLALSLRIGLADAEAAELLGLSPKLFARELRSARKQFARAAIAMALLTNPTRCPSTLSQQEKGMLLDRQRALQLVTHAAECQLCVPVMRTVDRRIIDDYRQAPDVELELPQRLSESELREVLAGRSLGLRERIPAPQVLLKWAAIAEAGSSMLLSAGLRLA